MQLRFNMKNKAGNKQETYFYVITNSNLNFADFSPTENKKLSNKI